MLGCVVDTTDCKVGKSVGFALGFALGKVGKVVGFALGLTLGTTAVCRVGLTVVGLAVGIAVVGLAVGIAVVGLAVTVGTSEGIMVGNAVGFTVGAFVNTLP